MMRSVILVTTLLWAGISGCNNHDVTLPRENTLTAWVGGKKWKVDELSLQAKMIYLNDRTCVLSISGTDKASHSRILLNVPAKVGYYVLNASNSPYLAYEDTAHTYSGYIYGLKQSGTVGIQDIDPERHEATGVFSVSFHDRKGEILNIKDGHFRVKFTEN